MKYGAADISSRLGSGRLMVLLIGYGNLLRSDDGVGPAIVSRMAAVLGDMPGVACLMPHQLTPELAEYVACADRVVFVDASVELPAGRVKIGRVDGRQAATAPLGHGETPERLLGLCEALYSRVPSAWSVAVGVRNMAVGDRLSPAVSRAAGRLCRRLGYRVRRWCGTVKQELTEKDVAHGIA